MDSYFTLDNSNSIIVDKITDERFSGNNIFKTDFKDKPNWIITLKKDAEFNFSEFNLNNQRNGKAYFLFSMDEGSKVSFEPKKENIQKSNTERYIIYLLIFIIFILSFYIYKIKYS